ncbi:MAG TPA: biliverdin-producing heme oxygenase [Chitinophagaceae bacterium]|nr:biliverdin-producing heme oxygenase [Chitinophagaceae bacterium]
MNTTIEFTERLKTATQEQHLAIEKAYWMAQLMNPCLKQDEYIIILKKWYQAIYSFEQELRLQKEKIEQVVPDWADRQKGLLLETDFKILNEALPEMEEQKDSNNVNELIGEFYVMEGSTLGRRVILKQLSKHSWFHPSFGNFFSGYGAETGNKWVNFRNYLNQYFLADDEKSGQTINGAKKAFESMYRHFN